MRYFAPRLVRKLPSSDQTDARKEEPVPLDELRGQAAWVLLGEPGAGKSEAFRQEREATGGKVISIAEFLIIARANALDPAWREEILYLDGLDEMRAGGGGYPTLFEMRAYLKKLGNPRFRIACRAADWFGSTDIANISQDGQFGVYALVPLNERDIKEILRQNHETPDPETFVEKARERGIDGLLENPQTLGLLAKAIRDDQWPKTRLETFELACEKLAQEGSKPHRDLARSNAVSSISMERILTAAGQLCAVLLLSGKSGVALDQNRADEQFPVVSDFDPGDVAAAWLAIGRFFLASAQERVVPCHRSIAEFLAARWLAKRVGDGLPLGRVLNLLLGSDERTVTGLRGLYGWLALHCKQARQRLIEADPLTVVLYGDAKTMPVEDKRRLFVGLQQEAETPNYNHYCRQVLSVSPFSALADKELVEDFAAILGMADHASQSKVVCVLDILAKGEPIPGLEQKLKAIVLNDTFESDIRRYALEIWLKYSLVPEAIDLLNAFCFGQNTETNDELAGVLLEQLYPKEIPAEELLQYLHPPAKRDVIAIGADYYLMFWVFTFPVVVPESHLSILLDQLVEYTDLTISDELAFSFDWCGALHKIISRGLQFYGDDINDERLYAWLGIGINNKSENLHSVHKEAIANWLAARPERYKAVFALCYKHCETSEHIQYSLHLEKSRLRDALPPCDIGLWHLEQASLIAHDVLTGEHLHEAIKALGDGRGCDGLSPEKIIAWGDANPRRRHLLDSVLFCEIPQWRLDDADRARRHERKRTEQRRIRTTEISPHLESIRNGAALPGVMYKLAGVWFGYDRDIHGDTEKARFESYSDNGSEVLEAAESGFIDCPERNDLPNVAEIIDLKTLRREYYFICQPCLAGMALRWQQHGKSFVDHLSEEQLRRMVAFCLTDDVGHKPEWFLYLVENNSALVAEVLVAYARAIFKAKQDIVPSFLYALTYENALRPLAQLSLIPLLASFPVRIKSTLLPYLKDLLKAALRDLPEQLKEWLKRKLTSKSMDVPQRVYWLAAGMLIDPAQYESVLWQYIGKAWVRANHLCAFVSDRYGRIDLGNDYELSAVSLGKLIELLAPHAELERHSGYVRVTEPMRMGESIYAMVSRLGALAEADQEITRLLANSALSKLKHSLEDAQHQLRLNQREKAFRFLSPQRVAAVLSKREPVDVADLAALTLDFLDQIARELRGNNSNRFADFWNVEIENNKQKPIGKRGEDLCRNTLMAWLRSFLEPHGIDCQPEGACFNHKRSDNRLSYRNEFALPIEIKRDENAELWTAMREQLMKKYAMAPEASGYGIYLVFWFGNKNDLPPPRDGKEKPVSPEELQTRLEALLNREERCRISVRVLDVSWPSLH